MSSDRDVLIGALLHGAKKAARIPNEDDTGILDISRFSGENCAEPSDLLSLAREHPKARQVAEECGVELRLMADRVAVELNIALRGPFRKLNSVLQLLSGRDTLQLALVRAAYQDRYARTLEEDFSERLKGAKREKALGLLHGDHAREFAARIFIVVSRRWQRDIFDDLRAVFNDGFARGGRALLLSAVALFDEKWAVVLGAQSFTALMEDRLAGRAAYFLAVLAGNMPAANAMLLKESLCCRKPDWQAACATLESCELRERDAMLGEFAQLIGESLDAVLKRLEKKWSGDPMYEMFCALRSDDDISQRTAILRAAILKRIIAWPGEVFLNQSHDTRYAVLNSYERIYGSSLYSDVRRRLKRKHDIELFRSYVERGELSLAELLRDCMIGYGTDVRGIKYLLSGLSPGEFTSVNADYQERFSRNLQKDLDLDLDPDDRFDVEVLLRGPPRDIAECYSRVCDRFAWERSGILTRVLHFCTPEWGCMQQDLPRAKEYYEQLTNAECTPSGEEEDRLKVLSQYVINACDSFRATKHYVADLLANLLSIVTVTGATSFGFSMGGWKAAYIVGAGATFTVSFLTRVPAQVALKGRSYGIAHVIRDLCYSFADGVTLTFGRIANTLGPIGQVLVRGTLGKTALESGSKVLMKFSVGLGSKVDERKRSNYLPRVAADPIPRSTMEFLRNQLENKAISKS